MYDEHFSGGAGVVTPSKPSPSYEQILPLPTPCFKMFLERSLNDPTTPLQASLTATPSPPPHKNFDHTLTGFIFSLFEDLSRKQS